MSFRILDIQRRLREVGRIRIGEQVPTSRGGKRPAKLEVFRLTSRDQAVIEAAASHFGGTAEPWDADGGRQWQVKTTTAEMPVVVPPGDMAFSQAYEQWSAGGCRVRCDGRWDHQNDKACHCNPEERDCAIHTRLSVMLPDLPGLGVWRLDTSGYYAAVELGGVVDLAAGYAERGQMLPARLRLEQRTVKRFKPDGSPETRRFAVPVLDLDVHPMALTGGTAVAASIESGGPAFEPVPAELESRPVAPVAEQVKSLEAGDDRPKRRNAAAPIPATGARPRSAADAAADDDLAPPQLPKKSTAKKAPAKKAAAKKKAPDVPVAEEARQDAIQARIDELTQQQRQNLAEWWKGEGFPGLRKGITDDQADAIGAHLDLYASDQAPADDEGAPVDTAGARNKKMWAMAAEAWPDDGDEDRDVLRKGLITVVSAGRTESSKDLEPAEWDALFTALTEITDGERELFLRSNGEWELRKTTRKAS